MENYQFIKSFPGNKNHSYFEELPASLYQKTSPRFVYGNEPSSLFLEGCYTLVKDRIPIGRFAFYENPELNYFDEKACSIGSYECENNLNTSNVLIEKAKEIAKAKGYSWVIGPMEGSTWNNYRFSNHNDSSNFFLEPYHHSYYNNQFLNTGFEPIKTFVSNLLPVESNNNVELKLIEERNENSGFNVRNLNSSDFENELKKIAQLSISGFSANFLFTSITEDEFVQKYLAIKPYLNTDFILMIENKDKKLDALIFCVPDYHDSLNKTLIVKSIVKNKHSNFYKLGKYTTLKINELALKKGFTKIIHAFMAEDNVSNKISKSDKGKAFKEYSLYGLKL